MTDSSEAERKESARRLRPVGNVSVEYSDGDDADDNCQIDGREYQVDGRRYLDTQY